MTAKEVKSKVRVFCRQNKVEKDVNYSLLTEIIEKLGFTIIEYNHIINSNEVQTLIDSLKLSDAVLRTRGFTYADSRFRLVFVHEDMSEDEKTIVLAHEAGHIFLGHLSSASVIGKDVREEFEANEFAHFLLNRSASDKAADWLAGHKAAVFAGIGALAVAAALLVGVSYSRQQAQYYGEYYITDTGNRYHEADCIFVKDKSNVQRLTKEQFESGKYERCHTCLPPDSVN